MPVDGRTRTAGHHRADDGARGVAETSGGVVITAPLPSLQPADRVVVPVTEGTDTIRVDVWADIVCPWCYIASATLAQGVSAFGDDEPQASVTVIHHSFLLMPDIAADFSGTTTDLLVETHGWSVAQIGAMHARLTAIAHSVGPEIDFSRVRPADTRAVHQLVHLAKAHGVQQDLVDRLFRAHFADGGHIGDVDELRAIAADVGLAADEVERVLIDGRHRSDVDADFAAARQHGVSGVPHVIVGGRIHLSGARPSEDYRHALRQVSSRAAA